MPVTENVSQHQVVVDSIKQMISLGQLKPGDKLPVEADLAEQLGVSRGSLREGVRALVAMGVLETKQGSGTTVTSLEPALLLGPLVFWADLQAGPSAFNVHVVRRALEVESAGLAARYSGDGELTELDKLLADAEQPVRNFDHDAAMRCDLKFHSAIARASANPVLLALIDALNQPTLRTRMWQSVHQAGRLEAAHREHAIILQHLHGHDVVAARAAMHAHLTQSIAHLTADQHGSSG